MNENEFKRAYIRLVEHKRLCPQRAKALLQRILQILRKEVKDP